MRRIKWYRKLRGGLWCRFEYNPTCFPDMRPKVFPRGQFKHYFWTHGEKEFTKWMGKRFCFSNTLEDYRKIQTQQNVILLRNTKYN